MAVSRLDTMQPNIASICHRVARLCAGIVVAVCLMGTASGVRAEQVDRAALARFVDAASRQHMYLQQMAKGACFVMGGIEPQRYADEVWTAEFSFAGGWADVISLAESAQGSPEILQRLTASADAYQTYSAAIMQIVHGDVQSVVMRQVLTLEVELQDRLSAVEDLIVTPGAVAPETVTFANTVRVAGQLRWLTQAASKQLCFAALGIDAETDGAVLGAMADGFAAHLVALEAGSADQNVNAPGNSLTSAQLQRVRTIWDADVSPGLRRVLSSGVATGEQAMQFSLSADILMREVDTVAKYYAAAR